MAASETELSIKTLCTDYAQHRITFEEFERGVDRLVAERVVRSDEATKRPA